MNKSKTLVLACEVREAYSVSSNELVFPALHSGGYLDDHKFTQRMWNKVLVKVEVRHRKFYRTRSTFISYALQLGIHQIEVAAFVGDSVAVIYRYYSGCIKGSNNIPKLF